ncbi:MAG: universal stress protein [Candidatus Obscuribacterales bacterium]|nr:universal stress protein [Candidatus Obscuribacterales bacterium]
MKVLIAIDDSECSQMAIKSVMNRSWSSNTEFEVLSVFEPFALQYVGWHTTYVPISMIEMEHDLIRIRRTTVDKRADALKKKFGENRVRGKVIEDLPWQGIVKEADAWGADLIIVGSHGRSGFSKLFLGSVAEAVVSHANCSVEVIKGHALEEPSIA